MMSIFHRHKHTYFHEPVAICGADFHFNTGSSRYFEWKECIKCNAVIVRRIHPDDLPKYKELRLVQVLLTEIPTWALGNTMVILPDYYLARDDLREQARIRHDAE